MTLHVPYSFVPGTKARAQEVNANFNSVLEYIDAKADNDLANLTQNGINTIKNVIGSTRSIGEIVCSNIPLSDSGLHLLDGSLLQYSGIYKAFITYISTLTETYSDLFVSESDWQTSVTNYGVCGKFVYDSTNNTVRLPKITGITEGTSDLSTLGDLVEAGLPNITGSLGDALMSPSVASGAFSTVASGTLHGIGTSTAKYSASFDASSSSSVYGNSSTVQPQTVKILYYIVIATSTKTDIQVDIDEIATDLNGKADTDFTNVNSTAKYNVIQYALANIQTTDSTKVGYIYNAYATAANVYAPSGGKWLVLTNYQLSTSTGAIYNLGAYTNSAPGSIIDGGTLVGTYSNGLYVTAVLLKIK